MRKQKNLVKPHERIRSVAGEFQILEVKFKF